jgi:hypothetical protein
MRGERRLIVLCVMALVVGSSAAAQTAGGRWEVEVHGGGMLPSNPTGGTVSLPPPGAVFTTAVANPSESRREPSWYFGDGALLFNQAVTALAQLPGLIVPLDPVLGRSLGEGKSGGSLGIRAGRLLTPRLSAEISVDYGFARPRIAPANTEALEATRASFIPAFEGMIRFNPNRVLNSVTSVATLEDGSARELISSGALLINLRNAGALMPYAAIGAGVVSVTGEMPSVVLRGNYQFRLPAGPPVNESDTVTVSDGRGRHTAAGILGGGVKYYVSSRWGLRFDTRVTISKSNETTILDATPNVALGITPAGRGALGGNPSIQFSNNSTDPVLSMGLTAVAASSLTGPAVTGFRTFAGSGAESRTNVTFGAFWRF